MRLELGMSQSEFWQLGFYDLSLWMDKIDFDRRKRNEDRELTMEMTRQMMCLTANINRNIKAKATPFEPTDFIRLSYDQDKKEEYNDDDLSKRLETLKKLFPDEQKEK